LHLGGFLAKISTSRADSARDLSRPGGCAVRIADSDEHAGREDDSGETLESFPAGKEPFEMPVCAVTYIGDRALALLQGEVDMATAPEVHRQLSAALAHPVSALTADLGRLTFLDCSGISVLLRTRTKADALGIEFAIESVHDQARRVIEICGLSELLGVPKLCTAPDPEMRS